MAEELNSISPKGCIDYANQLIKLCELPFPRISSIQDINSNFFVALFECITGLTIPDLLLSNDSITEVHNVQAVIDTLSLDLLNFSLYHINGEDVISGNIISIFNLLELLEAVFLHLFPHKEKNLKETPDTSSAEHLPSSEHLPSAEDRSMTVNSTNKLRRKTSSLKSVITSSEEDIPAIKVLKRKTCRNTLRKSHKNIPRSKTSQVSQNDSVSHSKGNADTVDRPKSPLKRKILKPPYRTVKRPHTEDIQQLYDLNFEKKIRALLHSDKSPTLRAQQMKKNYIQFLKSPLKKPPIPPCNKSFLLPHNLRHKSKSSSRKSPTRRVSQRKKSIKVPVSENTAKYGKDDDIPVIMQSLLEQFPGFQFPKNIQELLTKQYYQHLGLMHKQLRNTLLKKPLALIQTEKAIEDQTKLSAILVKDLKEKDYLRELNEHNMVVNKIKYGFRDARLESAKTRQYFDEFHKSMSRKMKKRNFSEDVLIENTFKEVLELQKQKVRELCQRVKEADKQDAKQHRQYLNALKNLYEEQLAMLTESVNAEQKDSFERAKSQKWAVAKMNQEIRKNLQKDVRSLQKDVLEMIEDIHFRELDAQNFITSFQQHDS